MTAEDHPVLGSIDVVRTIRQGENVASEPYVIANADDVVVVSGWALASGASRAGPVYARIADALIPASPMDRDDVAAVHGEAFVQSGFSVAVAVRAFDETLLDVDLCLEIADGRVVAFERRRIVVAAEAPARTSEQVRLDFVEAVDAGRSDGSELVVRSGDRIAFCGWGYEADAEDAGYGAAAVLVNGILYQAEYGLDRADVFEHVQVGPTVGFSCRVPTLRLPPGEYEGRARLYSADGHVVESANALRFRVDDGQGIP